MGDPPAFLSRPSLRPLARKEPLLIAIDNHTCFLKSRHTLMLVMNESDTGCNLGPYGDVKIVAPPPPPFSSLCCWDPRMV